MKCLTDNMGRLKKKTKENINESEKKRLFEFKKIFFSSFLLSLISLYVTSVAAIISFIIFQSYCLWSEKNYKKIKFEEKVHKIIEKSNKIKMD